MFLSALMVSANVAGADESCQLLRYVVLPMAPDLAGRITVPLALDGQKMNMLVDTGGAYSALGARAAKRIALEPKKMRYVQFHMFGGHKIDQYVTVKQMDIAGSVIADRDFVLLPEGQEIAGADGFVGAEFLKLFDVDFDFAGGKLSLFSQKHCPGQVVYWADDFAVVPFKLGDGGHISVNLLLDGKEVEALLDTGASHTVMSLETAAYAFDLDEETIKKDGHSFETLSFGGVTVSHPEISLISDTDSKLLGGFRRPKIIIGMNVLRQLHLYIAYKEQKLYVTAASAHK